MKNVEKKLKKIVREMTKNACDDIVFPYDESCFDNVLNDLQHTYEIEINDNTRITYQLINTIGECIERYAIDTELHKSDEIITHYEKSQNE